MPDEPLDRPETISYAKLYRRWEEGNWSAAAIDLTVDADHWRTKLSDLQRRAALWNYAMFLVGEEAVARTLTPVLDAAPEHDQKLFLTTQVVDEARHHVFFDRFMREVAGEGKDPGSTLRAMEPHLTWGFQEVFAELDRVTEALRKKPKDRPLLAQSVALYHLIIEGLLAIPGQHFIQRYVERLQILPGFATGMTNVSRDESRHVAFGVKFLGDLIRESSECRAAAIEMWERAMQWSVGVFIPPGNDHSYVECFDFTMQEIYAFGLRAFQTRIKRIGIEPTEIRMFAYQDPNLTYEQRAAQVLVLIRDGVLGDHRREPTLSPESFEILFDGMARTVDLDVARSLDGPIEWDFSDAEPWHIVVTDGHAEAKPGKAGEPALRLEASSGEFAKIAVQRTDPRMALLKRRLKVHGSLAAKARLPRLFR